MLNLPDYIMDTSSCKNGSGTAYNSSSSSSISSPSCVDMEGHSYVMVVRQIQYIPDLCRINLIYPVSENMRNTTYTDVHDILVYGFELSWFSFCCSTENRCNLDEATVKKYDCFNHYTEPYRRYCIMIMHTIFALFYIIRLQYGLVSVYVLRVYFIF
jgi:hypothetical protein